MVSGRVPNYVYDYAQNHNLSISDVIMRGFDSYRENDLSHAIERLRYHEDRVIQWRQIVLQHEQECNTKHTICNTIKKLFNDQCRGQRETKHLDLNWLQPKVNSLQEKGIPITIEELYEVCIRGDK